MGFAPKLITWYQGHKRDLPWRLTKDPYTIWLSEIILQQTRVDQGMNYFLKFIEHYPRVQDLAKASEEEVLKLWQGLGYYSRARNLHSTAKHIVKDHNGQFPVDHSEILKLKGIGEYTAAAICSFAYGQVYPVIDGNVFRVLSRIYGVKDAIDSGPGKKVFNQLANELIDKKNPAIYNQAIMEFGALQCTPKNPSCEDCPFRLNCYAFKNDQINELPFKAKKIKQSNRYFNYLVIKNKDSVFINKRANKGIWQGLYDFPLIESDTNIQHFKQLEGHPELTENIELIEKSTPYKHLLSHQKIQATFWLSACINPQHYREHFTEISLKEINNYPVPKLIENYLKTLL